MRLWFLLFMALLLIGCTSIPVPIPPPTVLTITTISLPDASLNRSYSQQLIATGGVAPYTWGIAAGSLPAGITLTPAGVLSGIPTQQGAFSFTIQVVDGASATAKIQIEGKINEIS